MLKVEINGNKYSLFWEHFNTNRAESEPRHNNEQIRSYTYCRLENEEGLALSGVKAYLKPKENFSRYFGRYYSLKKLLKGEKFSKNERKEFWKAFFKNSNKNYLENQ